MDNLETRPDTAVRIGVAFPVKAERPVQHGARQRPDHARRQRILFPHAFQVRQKACRVAIAHHHRVTVSDGQGKARPLHQVGHVLQTRQGGQAWGDTSGQFRFRFHQAFAQFGERAGSEQGAQEQAVRFQAPA